MADTKIEWTNKTWNPIRGCSMAKGSEAGGCLNCYAARMATRNLPELKSPTSGKPFARILQSAPRWTGDVELIESQLTLPLRWRKGQRIFVNSMSDLFHEDLTDGQILRVFDIMARCPQHTFQILTKRPRRMFEWFRKWADTKEADYEPKLARGPEAVKKAHTCGRAMMFALMLDSMGTPPPGCAYPVYDWMNGMIRWPNCFPNVWLGVSVEDQKTADLRIPILLKTPAAIRFVSYEPALGPVDFTRLTVDLSDVTHDLIAMRVARGEAVTRTSYENYPKSICLDALTGFSPAGKQPALDWIIVGGESGPGARPFDIQWARQTVEQCKAAGVACFVKQLGAAPMMEERLWFHAITETGRARILKAANIHKVPANFVPLAMKDRKGGEITEWPEDLRVRDFPSGARTTIQENA